MSTVQVNLAHAFNLRVIVGKNTVMFPLRRGLNWIDESLKDTPEWKALISRIELPIEAVQAQLADPVRGLSGGVPTNPDAAVAQAKLNAERAIEENRLYEQRKKENEEIEKSRARSISEAEQDPGPLHGHPVDERIPKSARRGRRK
jgi:hypothetical protein